MRRFNIQLRQIIDRWLNGGFWRIFLALGLAGLIYIIISTIVILVLKTKFTNGADSENQWWLVYYLFADAGNQMSYEWSDNIHRGIGMVVSTLGSIFLSGLLISTITNLFERKADKWRAGFSYYKLKNHIVIIGSDQMVYGLVNQLCESCDNHIVVMTSKDAEQTRNAIYASLSDKKFKDRIIVNYGQRDSATFLELINIAYAKEVFLLGDTSEFDDIESYHDSLNVQSLTLIAKLCKEAKREKLPCNVLFDYKTTYYIFQYANLSSEITDYINFHPFNFCDFWARKVLVAGHSKEGDISYKPLDYRPITSRDSDDYVHFIIIGMSKMGQAMALQAAHIAHFPNYQRKKTKITLIDCNGHTEMNEFKQKCGELFKVSRSTYIDATAWSEAEESRLENEPAIDGERYITRYGISDEYLHLVDKDDNNKEFIDIEWEFIKGDDHNPVVQRLLNSYIEDKNAIITVAVCLNLTHISLRSAMHLPKRYYENNIPILVQQRKTSTIVTTLNGKGLDPSEQDKLLYKNLKPFGMVCDCYDLNLMSSIGVCKRINYTYDYYYKNKKLPAKIDMNEANSLWSKLTISKRWSNVFTATSIPTKLRCIGIDFRFSDGPKALSLTEENIALLTEIEHNRWNVEELLLGYRPVRIDEELDIDANRAAKKGYKDRFIHYDIRPYYGLKEDNSGRKASVYDEVIVRSLPQILNDRK